LNGVVVERAAHVGRSPAEAAPAVSPIDAQLIAESDATIARTRGGRRAPRAGMDGH
jgi:hypothetical protein